jgi:hypothetical protein
LVGFILQEQNDDGWHDIDNTLRATDSEGRIQILNLTPGKNYRWQQIDFAEHYDTDSFMIVPEQAAATKNIRSTKNAAGSSASFTMPTNSGISFRATNALQTFKITYVLGDGANDGDINYEQNYGEETKVPDMTAVSVRSGYEFQGWSQEIAHTVTEDAVYSAKWSHTSSTSSNTFGPKITPEAVKTSKNPELPYTYDGISDHVRMLIVSLIISLGFLPRVVRAYRVHRYRK